MSRAWVFSGNVLDYRLANEDENENQLKHIGCLFMGKEGRLKKQMQTHLHNSMNGSVIGLT